MCVFLEILYFVYLTANSAKAIFFQKCGKQTIYGNKLVWKSDKYAKIHEMILFQKVKLGSAHKNEKLCVNTN